MIIQDNISTIYNPSAGILVGLNKACFIEFPDSGVEMYVILKYLHPKEGWRSVVVTPQNIYHEIIRIYEVLKA